MYLCMCAPVPMSAYEHLCEFVCVHAHVLVLCMCVETEAAGLICVSLVESSPLSIGHTVLPALDEVCMVS